MVSSAPNSLRFLRRAALGAALVLGAGWGCGKKEVPFDLVISTGSCASVHPLDGAELMRFIVTGDELPEPLQVDAPVAEKTATIPAIPVGKNRVLEVRAYSGDSTIAGRVVAVGRTAPFEVPADFGDGASASAVQLKVVLRRTNVLLPPSSGGDSESCLLLAGGRAGHTATVLPDGLVFLAGGFSVGTAPLADGGTEVTRTSLGSTEIFDPLSGTVTPGPPLGVKTSEGVFSELPRAFHTATLLSTGQVLLAGGEVTRGALLSVTRSALVLDYPAADGAPAYGSFQLEAARTRHGAAHDADAGVLLVGGLASDGGVVETLEWYESRAGRISRVEATLKREGMNVLPLAGGEQLVVAGGSDGEVLRREIPRYVFDEAQKTFRESGSPFTLPRARRNAAGAQLGAPEQRRAILIGGYAVDGDTGEPTAVNTTDLIIGAESRAQEGPVISSARGDICAVTMKDGRVLSIGGRTTAFFGPTADDSVELISVNAEGKTTVLGMEKLSPGRYHHSCTALPDGSILVAGGLAENGGNVSVLKDLLIFMPTPLEP